MRGSEPPAMRRGERALRRASGWHGVALIALVALLGIAALGLGAVAVAASPHSGQMSAVTVGVSDTNMQAAVNAASWPQQQSNWCGVAAIAAIANYVHPGSASQTSVANFLNSTPAQSVWGTPSYIYPGPAFVADIARDSGTDPRAIARGLGWATGGLYHNIVDYNGAWDATWHLAVDLRDYGQPITVIVDGGQHSVVVSAIIANGDPIADQNSITGIEVWDPGVNAFNAEIQAMQREIVPIWSWYNEIQYWGRAYNDVYDPDPSVGVYAGKQLWTGNYVYIRAWGLSNGGADWALYPWGAPIPGLHGEYPPGYTPPTPTPTPTPTATPTPLPIRHARAAPTSLAATAAPQSGAVALAATGSPGAANVALAPPAVETPAAASASCAGPYCLSSADLPWWAAALGCILLLAALWGAIFTRARRADAALATGPPAGDG